MDDPGAANSCSSPTMKHDDTSCGATSEFRSRTEDKGSVMNIGEAKRYFKTRQDAAIDELDNLVKVWREYGVKDPWPNSTFSHALGLTGVMLRHTDISYRMLTSGAGDGFISSLSDKFTLMLKRLQENGGFAKIIIVDGPTNNVCLEELEKNFQDVLSVKRGTVKRGTAGDNQIAHYIVCDNDMVRDEESHGDLTDETSESDVKADVYFNNTSMATLFASRFDSLWDRLKD